MLPTSVAVPHTVKCLHTGMLTAAEAYLTRHAEESPTLAIHSWSPCTSASVHVAPHSSRRSQPCSQQTPFEFP